MTLTGQPPARTPSSSTSAAVFPIADAYPALRFFPPPFTVVNETWQPVLPVYTSQKQAKKAHVVYHGVRTMAFKLACSLMSCMQHTPACTTCMYSRSTQITGMVTSIVVLWFARTPPPLCQSWKEFLSFCSGNGGRIARELFAILPAASLSRRSTKQTSDWQWRRRYGVCCWLGIQPTINTTFLPTTYRCLKQAHRRRFEGTPLPSPTQTRLNTCELQVYMIY